MGVGVEVIYGVGVALGVGVLEGATIFTGITGAEAAVPSLEMLAEFTGYESLERSVPVRVPGAEPPVTSVHVNDAGAPNRVATEFEIGPAPGNAVA